MRVLLIDAMPVVYANFAKVGHLSVQAGPHQGTPTGLRYGVLRTLNSYRKRTGADKIVVAWDTPEPILKARPFNDFLVSQAGSDLDEVMKASADVYKAGRSQVIEEGASGKKVDKRVMYDQLADLKEMLTLTAFSQVEAPGYEADDLCGALAGQLNQQGHEVIIYSSDNDLCQAVTDRTRIFVPNMFGKKDGMKDLPWVQEKFGCTGPNIAILRAFLGDRSDNLKGLLHHVNGTPVAEDTVRDILATHPNVTVESFIENIPSEPGRQAILNHLPLLEALVHLMRLHTPPSDVRKITHGKKDATALEALFATLEFQSMMKVIPELCS